jgi:hypothetical protein
MALGSDGHRSSSRFFHRIESSNGLSRTFAVATVVLGVIGYIGFLTVNQAIFVKADRDVYVDSKEVFFPIVLDENFAEAVSEAGSRTQLLNDYGPDSIREELPSMSGYEGKRQATMALVFLLFSTVHFSFSVVVLTLPLPERRRPNRILLDSKEASKRFLVALTFPGSERALVEKVATELAHSLSKERVFYDRFYTSELAKPNLDTTLLSIYRAQSKLVVVFLCDEYQRRDWCGLEWRAVRSLIFERRDDEVMLVKLGDGQVEGILPIDGFIDAQRLEFHDIAGLILERLNQVIHRSSKPEAERAEIDDQSVARLRRDLLKAKASQQGAVCLNQLLNLLVDRPSDNILVILRDDYDFRSLEACFSDADQKLFECDRTMQTVLQSACLSDALYLVGKGFSITFEQSNSVERLLEDLCIKLADTVKSELLHEKEEQVGRKVFQLASRGNRDELLSWFGIDRADLD